MIFEIKLEIRLNYGKFNLMANQTVTFSLVCLPTLWLFDGLIPEFLDYPLELLVLDIERLETYPYLLFGLGLPLLSGLGLFL